MGALLRGIIWSTAVIIVVIVAARLTVLRWWQVPQNDPFLNASIAPTLSGGDWVLLWRFTEPKFGDLVKCPEPGRPSQVVIARLLGEAGDEVQVQDSSVSVNGRAIQTEGPCTERNFKVQDPSSGSELSQSCQLEIVGGSAHPRGSTSGHKIQPLPVRRQVGEGKIFLVSDNRLFPYDSRDFGSVSRSTCDESIVFRLISSEGFFDVERRFTFIR